MILIAAMCASLVASAAVPPQGGAPTTSAPEGSKTGSALLHPRPKKSPTRGCPQDGRIPGHYIVRF